MANWGPAAQRTHQVLDTDDDVEWEALNMVKAQKKRILFKRSDQLVHLQDIALSYSDQNVARAGELLRHALIGNDVPAPVPGPGWNRYGGLVASAGDRGCPYDHTNIAAMMDEITRIWGFDEMGIFKFADSPYNPAKWGPTRDFYRVFDHDACEQLSERRSSDPEKMAFFAHTACTHRMIVAHITSLMGCDYLEVDFSYVSQHTHLQGS